MTLLGCSTQIFAGQPLDEFLPLIAESGYVEIELCSSPVEHPILPPIELDRPSSYYTDLKRKISLFCIVATGAVQRFPRRCRWSPARRLDDAGCSV